MLIVVREPFSDSDTQIMERFHTMRGERMFLYSCSNLLKGMENGEVNQARIYGGIGGAGGSGKSRSSLSADAFIALPMTTVFPDPDGSVI
jgi:hypothetical protein